MKVNKIRPVRKFSMRYPFNAERSYKRACSDLFKHLRELVQNDILSNFTRLKKERKTEIKNDSAIDQVLLFISAIKNTHLHFLSVAGLSSKFMEIFTEVGDINKADLTRMFSESTGISPLLSEPWMIPEIEAFTSYNVGKITTLQEGLLSQVEEIVTRSVRSGATYKSLAAELNQAFYSCRRKSELVARDQINKFHASVNRIRQMKNGITKFIWRQNERGERSRITHRKFNGQVFSWASGADGIYPGDELHCGCRAEPVL